MSPFLNSLKDELRVVEEEIKTLPGELDSIVARLDWGKLRSLLSRLNQDRNELYDKQFAAQRAGALALPFIIQPDYPYIREITDQDLSRWREAYKSEVRVVIGKGRVEVIAPSELAGEYKTTVSQIILIAQQQGYTVLRWGQYQKLSDEISKLSCGHTWVPRESEITICPKCKSPYWNKPRQVKESQDESSTIDQSQQ